MRFVILHAFGSFFLVCLACCAVVTMQGQSVWIQQLPAQRMHDLHAVDFVNGDMGIAVGALGSIVRTSNGGETWQTQTSGARQKLNAIDMRDAFVGIAVGDSGTVLTTHDAGATWVQSPLLTLASLHDVVFVDSQIAIAVGDSDTNGRAPILRTTDAGVTWTLSHSDVTCGLAGVDFGDANIGVAVGGCGAILRTTDAGLTWSAVSSEIINDLPEWKRSLQGIAFGDATTVFAILSSGDFMLRSVDAGVTWTKETVTGAASYESYEDISFSDALHGTLLNYGMLYRTTDGAETWTQIPGTGSLWGITFVDNAVGMAVGSAGVTLRTTDGGATWTNQRKGLVASLYSVSFFDPFNGLAVGGGGVILRTTNTGRTWVPENSGTTESLTSVAFTHANSGVVGLASRGLMNIDDTTGMWTRRPHSFEQRVSSLCFVDSEIGYAVGGDWTGAMWRTIDGGDTWTWIENRFSESGGIIRKVIFSDFYYGFALLEMGSIWNTGDGGSRWTPTAHIKPNFQALNLCLLGPEELVVVGTDGFIAHSTDGGSTWDVQHSGTTSNLWAVDFFDANNGIAVGEYGAIVRTTNGGKTWAVEERISDFRLSDVEFTTLNTATAVGALGTILRGTFTNVPSSVSNDDASNHTMIVKLYPNPADDVITIEFARDVKDMHNVSVAGTADDVVIDVYDNMNSCVSSALYRLSSTALQRVSIATHALASGVYYCSVQSAGSVVNQAFVVSR